MAAQGLLDKQILQEWRDRQPKLEVQSKHRFEESSFAMRHSIESITPIPEETLLSAGSNSVQDSTSVVIASPA